MSVTLSPNMSLPIPVVGTEAGPDYASDVNNSLTILDQHNHSLGSGVQITPSGLNINANLPLNNNTLTLTKSIQFQSQSAALTAVGSLYEVSNDLYFTDGEGNQIRITQSGSVAGSSGTITGLPSGTASASFASSTFVFQSATNTAAAIDGASFILRNNTANSFGLTLQPPNAMGANYSLTLPSVPAQTNVMTLDSSGNMGSITYDAVGQAMTSVGANALRTTTTKSSASPAAVGNVAQSNSSGFQSLTSTSPTAVTSLNISVTTVGKPVRIEVIPAAGDSYFTFNNNLSIGSPTKLGFFELKRNGTSLSIARIGNSSGDGTSVISTSYPSVLSFYDLPSAGSQNYILYAYTSAASGAEIQVNNIQMIAYEMN